GAQRPAAARLQDEVSDVACLTALDPAPLESSVRKTGRCAIAHEAPTSAGLSRHIVQSLYERVLFALRAPIQRVAAAAIPPPL
ncbi:transketolase C-terminal domain-containing protein, partial [Pseudomonas aeruginosa]